MARIISASIDVTKIDKSKLISGKKGTYLNIDIVVNDEKNDYGQDTSIKLSQSQEERQAKTPATYLGNGKTVWSNEPSASKPEPEEFKSNNKEEDFDNLPF